MNLPGWLKWALRRAIGTARGNVAISLLEGPIGALLDSVAFRGRGTGELERITNQAQKAIDDINEVIR